MRPMAHSLLWGLICDLKQHIGMAGLVERTPTRKVLSPKIGCCSALPGPRSALINPSAKQLYSCHPILDAASRGDMIAPHRRAIYLYRIARHPPALRPPQLNPFRHLTLLAETAKLPQRFIA